jgi:hypothetical protein
MNSGPARRRASKIASTFVLTTGAVLVAADDLQAQSNSAAGFLGPLPRLFVLPDSDPRRPVACRNLKCPPILTYAGEAGGFPSIDPAFRADLPNARVSFAVQGVSHDVVSGPAPTSTC